MSGSIAQWLKHWPCKPGVLSSNLPATTDHENTEIAGGRPGPGDVTFSNHVAAAQN